ncbi:MAG: signal peptide peptidase SppA [Rhodospirillaceae bacterium]|jgi:protease-4|nr:signal peptide peptidase SppA [Rhodospirillaceae bacterium]
MRLFGRIIFIILAIIGGLVLLISGFGTVVAMKKQSLPNQMVLMLNLNKGVLETESTGLITQLNQNDAYVLKNLIETLDRASRDPKVTALVARIDSVPISITKSQEIRDAIQAFRKSNKRTIFYSSGFEENSNGTINYYLASAFQEIWIQPSGIVGLTGFITESPFFKDTLDMLGIKADFMARHEYKSAIEPLMKKQFTKESRESLKMILDSWSNQTIAGIANNRSLSTSHVKMLIDRAPLLAYEAKNSGLIDRLAYWDEIEKELNKEVIKFVDIRNYEKMLDIEPNAVKVALIYGTGIVQHDEVKNQLTNENVMSSKRIIKAFRDAIKDSEVKAILFRINSPGGSYSASDSIWREVGNARAAGKPVIVSMGDVAASGGYFVAMAADRIIAEPGTITGSIGVFMGKIVLVDFWKKLGISWDEIHTGKNSTLLSNNSSFSSTERDRMNAILDFIYNDFLQKVQHARKLKSKDMDKIARGRIWSGNEAMRIGLIDQTGGYDVAIKHIRELTNSSSQTPINLVQFPSTKKSLEYLMDMIHGQLPEDLIRAFTLETRLLRLISCLKTIVGLDVTSNSQKLLMMPVELK